MGIGGMGVWQLLIILVIVLLLFGTKRLKGLGGDLGSAIKGFKKAVGDEKGKEPVVEDEDLKKVEDEVTETSPVEEPQKTDTKT